jgi:hypothetical protein
MNKKLVTSIFLLFVLFTESVNGQITWLKTYGGSNHDIGESIISTGDGNYVFTGKTGSTDKDFQGVSKGGDDICVVKIDSLGKIIWKRKYGGWLNDHGISITLTTDSNLIIIGNTTSNDGDFGGINNGGTDICILKLNMNGDLLWRKLIGGTENENVRHLICTQDGGYVITGSSNSDDGDFRDMRIDNDSSIHGDLYVIKLDNVGNIVWKKSYGGTQYDEGVSIIELKDHSFIVSGNSRNIDGDFMNSKKGNIDVVLFKIDSLGNMIWNLSFGGNVDEGVYSMIRTKDEGIVLTGITNSNDQDFRSMNKGGEEIFTIKFDTNGNLLWKKTYGGTDFDRSFSVTTDITGNLLYTGTSRSNNGDFNGMNYGWDDIVVFKLDLNGEIIWKKTIGGLYGEEGKSISSTNDGGSILTGYSNSYLSDIDGINRGLSDIFVMKLDSNGNLNNTTSINEFSEPTTTLSVHPNPFHNSTTVSYKVETPSNVRIELLNTLGQTVEVLREDYTDIGTYQLPLNVSTLSSGMYSVRMRYGSMNEVVPVWVVR